MDCILEVIGEDELKERDLVRCKVCNRQFSIFKKLNVDYSKLKKNCTLIVGPSLLKKITNYSLAQIGHVFRGNPTCTQEEIDARLKICKLCEYYLIDKNNPEIGICTHASCGCTVTRKEVYISKLAWKDQHCPIENW